MLQELENFKEEKNYFGKNGQERSKRGMDFYSDLDMQAGVCWEGKKYHPKEWQRSKFQRWKWMSPTGRHSKPIWLSGRAMEGSNGRKMLKGYTR